MFTFEEIKFDRSNNENNTAIVLKTSTPTSLVTSPLVKSADTFLPEMFFKLKR